MTGFAADVLIMAGGRSARMRVRGDPTHKALVPLDGVPMIERCALDVIALGVRSLTIACSERETEVLAFVRGRLAAFADHARVPFTCVAEAHPLGTIGAAATVRMSTDALLVLNVDNVTDLDLRDLVRHHRSTGAALTIAAHRESFPLPFGQVDIAAGCVRAYHEKPVYRPWVSSGTYVLSPLAIASIEPAERIDLPQLYERLRERAARVSAYQHAAEWVDVNDAAALARANDLFSRRCASRLAGTATR